jgi:PIN domain
MAIYLDSNVLYPWRKFTELDRVAVSIVASQTKQVILVPWLVAEEACAHYRRSLETAVARLDSAISDVNHTFDELEDVWFDPIPNVDRQLESWRERLDRMAETIPPVAEDAVEALRREVWGIAPARRTDKSGVGARDAAIWLAIARDHAGRGEEGHFISEDRDFIKGDGLRRPKENDLATDHPLHLHSGVAEFLSVLGVAVGAKVDVADLRAAAQTVRMILADAVEILRAVFDPLVAEHRYRTDVKQAQPVRVLAARRYERGDEALLVVDSEWELVADILHQPRDRDDNRWYVHEDVEVGGTLQMYLPAGAHPEVMPQIISARLSSDYSVYIKPDQVLTIQSGARTADES